MHNLALVVLTVGLGVYHWAADGKSRALRKVHTPTSNAPAIEAAKYVHQTELELEAHLEGLAGLHSTFFAAEHTRSGAGFDLTTSRSAGANTTVTEQLETLDKHLYELSLSVAANRSKYWKKGISKCALDADRKDDIVKTCRLYTSLAEDDWDAWDAWDAIDYQLRMEEVFYSGCARVAKTLRDENIPDYLTTVGAVKTRLTALAATICSERQTIDHVRDAAHTHYNTTLYAGGVDWTARSTALAAIDGRERDLETAQNVHDGIADALTHLDGTFGERFVLNGAVQELSWKEGVWSRGWQWIDERPDEVVEHLLRLADRG